MAARVYALPVVGHAREVGVAAHIKPDGSLGLFGTAGYAKGRVGSGAYHGVEVWMVGPNGGISDGVVLSPKDWAAKHAHAMGAETVAAIYYGAAHYLGLTHIAGPVIRADNPQDRRRLRDAWRTARRIGR